MYMNTVQKVPPNLVHRFETEEEKRKRLKEEAKAKEMADVAIVFRLSEPSPLYETVRVQEAANPDCIKVFSPSSPKPVAYHTERQTSTTTSSKESLTQRPQTSMTRNTSKTVEIAQARPTTSLTRSGKRQTFLSVPTSTEVRNYSQQTRTGRPYNKPITGNKILFETHTGEEDEDATLKKPKSKRLLRMKFSSGTSNYRYAEGLEYNSDMKIIVTQ